MMQTLFKYVKYSQHLLLNIILKKYIPKLYYLEIVCDGESLLEKYANSLIYVLIRSLRISTIFIYFLKIPQICCVSAIRNK